MAEEEKEAVLLVYVGSRVGSKTAIDYFLEVTEEQFDKAEVPDTDETSNLYRTYSGKGVNRYMKGGVGAVYSVPQAKGSKSIYTAEAEYKGRWGDKDQILKWQMTHRTAITTVDLRKKAKKEGAEDNFIPLLPFKERYNRLVSQNQRAALLAQVIAYITG